MTLLGGRQDNRMGCFLSNNLSLSPAGRRDDPETFSIASRVYLIYLARGFPFSLVVFYTRLLFSLYVLLYLLLNLLVRHTR